MFHAILPTPHVFSTPAMVNTDTYDIELVEALNVADFKTGSLLLRVHGGLANLTLTLKAFKIWPFDDAVGVRFQDATPLLLSASASSGTADAGKLFTTETPTTLCVPALRIVLELKATNTITAGSIVTVSAGIALLTN